MDDDKEGVDATVDVFAESFMRLVRERLSINATPCNDGWIVMLIDTPAGSAGTTDQKIFARLELSMYPQPLPMPPPPPMPPLPPPPLPPICTARVLPASG